MTEKCFEIGTIQAFLDGELDNEMLAQVAHHVSVCDDCALMLADAESESAFAFAALDTELNYLVPTERIRTNLYEQIRAERKSFWTKIFGDGFRWTNPSVAAFASLILIAGVFAAFLTIGENDQPAVIETAKVEQSSSGKISVENGQPAKNPSVSATDDASLIINSENSANEKTLPRFEKVNVKTNTENRSVIQNAVYRTTKPAAKNQSATNGRTLNDASMPAANGELVGEESYLKTIATLNQTVNSGKDQALRPSERVAFEKDLAVVNDSIAKMQKEVRRHPKNEAAKELLRASYQNKIDLLNSVADKTELIALR